MLYREWNVARPDEQASARLSAELGLGKLVCDVLAARGYDDPAKARALLGEGEGISDPFLLDDMDKAVACIQSAIDNEEPMVIFGDYDVDGVTATALLYTSLASMGAEVFFKLANRNDDGYGLSARIVDEIADRGIDLIITVDNGVSAIEAAERAKERGVRLVVTDHHLPPEKRPEVEALVDPHCTEGENPFKCFSGAGVAFLLAAALEGCDPVELLEVFGDLAAIGTIADVMQLTGENRTLVRAGLAALQETERPGLAALIEACGFAGKPIGVETISYGLAPRLNAAGRMDDATDALRLLLAEDEEEAAALATYLCEQNAARQAAESAIVEGIAEEIEADPALSAARILVVWGEGWHQGIIGIVANRLVDKFAKPAVVIALDGEEGRGSGRSLPGISLHGALASCQDILVRYGGHDVAAGLSIEKRHLEAFRDRMNAWAEANCPVIALPELVVDAPVALSGLDVQAVAALEALAPCGSGNPAPKFIVENAVIDTIWPVSEGKHCRLRVKQATPGKGEGMLYAVLFGTGPAKLGYHVGDAVDLLVGLSVYEGKNGPQVSARVIEMRPAGLKNEHVGQSALFESFSCGGEVAGELRGRLQPSREDTAVVYRAVRDPAFAVCYGDLRPLFKRLGEEGTGRWLTALAMLEELGLIKRNETNSCFEAVPSPPKQDLTTSRIYKRLEV